MCGGLGREMGQREGLARATRKAFWVVDMLIILFVEIVFLMFIYVIIYHIADFKYVLFMICQLHLNKLFKIKGNLKLSRVIESDNMANF